MILGGDGHGMFTSAGLYTVGAGPEGIVAADFNGDGKIDIAVNNLNDYSVALLLSNGDGTFVPAANRTDDTARPFGWAAWNYPAFVTAGDLTGNGKPDIVVVNYLRRRETFYGIKKTRRRPHQLRSPQGKRTRPPSQPPPPRPTRPLVPPPRATQL